MLPLPGLTVECFSTHRAPTGRISRPRQHKPAPARWGGQRQLQAGCPPPLRSGQFRASSLQSLAVPWPPTAPEELFLAWRVTCIAVSMHACPGHGGGDHMLLCICVGLWGCAHTCTVHMCRAHKYVWVCVHTVDRRNPAWVTCSVLRWFLWNNSRTLLTWHMVAVHPKPRDV